MGADVCGVEVLTEPQRMEIFAPLGALVIRIARDVTEEPREVRGNGRMGNGNVTYSLITLRIRRSFAKLELTVLGWQDILDCLEYGDVLGPRGDDMGLCHFCKGKDVLRPSEDDGNVSLLADGLDIPNSSTMTVGVGR